MRKLPTILACAALAGAVPVIAQTVPRPATVAREATPAEAAVHALVSAINGNMDRAGFVNSAFSSKALQNASAASRLQWLNKLADDSGGLSLVSAQSNGDRMAEAVVKARRAEKFGKFVLFTSGDERGKIANLFLLPARDPAKVKAEAWPTGPLVLSRVAAEIEKRVAALAAEDSFSGTVLVAKGDRVIFKRAYGLADQAWRIPNRTDTAFHTGSVGKMFTAAAVMRLARDGKLSLDDSLAKWVPDYPHPEAARITLKHLLSHSGGIGDWDVRVKEPLTGAAAAARMTAPLRFAPGERFEYSNAGFVLLGAAIEKATGKPLDAALSELVFKPAGMERTGLWPVTGIVPNRATGYLRPPEDALGLGPRYSNEQYLGFSGDGSGGAYTTVDDLFAFNRALVGGRLLGPELTREMLTPRLDFAGAPRPMKYGYGVNLADCAGHKTFGHGGGGANSGVAAVTHTTLETGWTVIVLSNYDPPAADDLALGICEFVAGR